MIRRGRFSSRVSATVSWRMIVGSFAGSSRLHQAGRHTGSAGWLGLFGLCVSVSCGTDEPQPSTPPAAECAIDSECAFGAYCDFGVCVAGCRENGDCGYRRPCIDGACPSTSGTCTQDIHCDFGDQCDLPNNRCVAGPGRTLCDICTYRYCVKNADCPGSDTCVDKNENGVGNCTACGKARCYARIASDARSCLRDSDCDPAPLEGIAGLGQLEYCHRLPCRNDDYCAGEQAGTCTVPYAPRGVVWPGVNGCSLGTCAKAHCVDTSCKERADCGHGFTCFEIAPIGHPARTACTSSAECGGRPCRLTNETSTQKLCGCRVDADCTANGGEGECSTDGNCITERRCLPALGLTCEDFR